MIELLHAWFYSPKWLWLIPCVIPLLTWDMARGWGQARLGRRLLGGFVRLCILASLAAALADPRWHRNEEVAHVIMVVCLLYTS